MSKRRNTGNATRPRAEIEDAIERLKTEVDAANKGIADCILGDNPANDKDISQHLKVSRRLLGKYVTLNWGHYLAILRLMGQIESYRRDKSRHRPLNILLQASPGSGKSHFAKYLAANMSRVEAVPCNMSSMKSLADFSVPLERVRNLKVADKMPMLFLDEFDSSNENYAILLPLLWDGELRVGVHVLRLGKVVIVLAGSKPEVQAAIDLGKNVQLEDPYDPETVNQKLPDLVSRINGLQFGIPRLDSHGDDEGRTVDKVCIAVALLTARFPRLQTVPWALLHFVAKTRFRYGVRSISHVIDLINDTGYELQELPLDAAQLPLATPEDLKRSNLVRHILHEHGIAAVVNTWKEACAANCPVQIARPEQIEDDFKMVMEALDNM